MLIKAVTKFERISPKKLRLVSSEVKKMRISDALNALTYSNKKGALLLKKTLDSALSNAKNNFKVAREDLFIKEIRIDQGPVFKRWIAVSKGSAHPYKKRTSHLTVVLETIRKVVQKPEAEKPEAKKATKVLTKEKKGVKNGA